MSKKISIFTANSNTGSACLKEIYDKYSSQFSIRAVFRSEANSKSFLLDYPDVEIVIGCDAERVETLDKAFINCDYALIVTPFDAKRGFQHDAKLTQNIIDSAVKSNVEYIVLITSWTSNYPDEIPQLASRFISSERLLEKYSSIGIKWTILRGGCFMENLITSVKNSIENSIFEYPNILCPYVDTRDIGRSAAACLTAQDIRVHDKQIYEMTGPKKLNGKELAEIISKVYDNKVIYKSMPRYKFKSVMHEAIVEVFEFMLKNKNSLPFTNDVKYLTGWSTSFETFLRDHIYEINNNLMKPII